ncbi:MAG: response regulator [Candidatus Omnitrophica bacterium]|nr:response regulator [Candidatus Omnitrophota bacterium]MBU1128695.1 response regulator [Candidatus Omnitrophota bacterium]MBU1784810.1 response regulator [Candidatus Omnitrophota bacterium]MBU1850972.1 response regulator [Candidatus Omnitrophota bacterium]
MNGKKIVIAEDNKDIRELIQRALENVGYEVGAVEDGFALIAYLKANQDIDAVILDLVMPERGGVSVFDTVHSVSPASKIVIYTAYADYKDSVYGKKADAFVEKTEGVGKITQTLKELL